MYLYLLVFSHYVMSYSLVASWTIAHQAPLSMDDFPGKNTRVGCHLLLQGIFLTQGSNQHLLCLLHWQMYSLPLSYLGSLCIYRDVCVCVCVCVCACAQLLNHVWLFVTLWAEAHHASLFMGVFRQEYLSGFPFPTPEDLPNPGIEPTSPASVGRFFFTTAPPRKHLYR